MSLPNREAEDNHDHGGDAGVGARPTGTASPYDPRALGGGGASSRGGDLGVSRLPAGTDAARVPATSAAPHRAAAEGGNAAAGEERASPGPEAFAGQGGPAVIRAQHPTCHDALIA